MGNSGNYVRHKSNSEKSFSDSDLMKKINYLGHELDKLKHKYNAGIDNTPVDKADTQIKTINEEYEMKFLVYPEYYSFIKTNAHSHTSRVQGYVDINSTSLSQIRISKRGDRDYGLITFKTVRNVAHRTEFEYRIPAKDAYDLIDKCNWVVRKTRYFLTDKDTGLEYEIDFFEEKNTGLVMAEIEFNDAISYYDYRYNLDKMKPKWLGKDVTDNMCYYNDYLAQFPFGSWE